MLCIIENSTDPVWNLAAEEYLLKSFREDIFRLWRNGPSVIIGRHQNAMAQVDAAYLQSRGIPVVRRLTGGGAVYHDLGNVNFTFISARRSDEDAGAMFRRFTAPIVGALRSLGVDASLEGRNDLMIAGRKFAGNSMCIEGNRVLQHGCMLFNASLGDLSQALKSHPEKFEGKSVDSNRSRVTNISEHLPSPMSPSGFIAYLKESIAPLTSVYQYNDEDLAAIDQLVHTRYCRDEWNWGASPRYTFRNSRRFPSGSVELCLNVAKGVIDSAEIMGDYFFTLPTEDFCNLLKGVRHDRTAIEKALEGVPVGSYFAGLSSDDILNLF